ncbi:hypothetical protein ACIHCM_35005 [Streptomyces sp. NPDC052023]|uniref:hypothetical protein n=1 Tax=Streptomyces sp. NPDC052023 TaxID=3365681 RepID=UPI0037D25127
MGIWVSIITAVSGLLGAGIGITGSLLGERWRARTSADQEQRAAELRLRDERKDVLIRFFALVREVERVAERGHAGEEAAADEVRDLTSRLWLLHVEVHLLCTAPTADAVYTLTERLRTPNEMIFEVIGSLSGTVDVGVWGGTVEAMGSRQRVVGGDRAAVAHS